MNLENFRPESDKLPLLSIGQPLYPLKITRKFYVSLDKKEFKFKYQFNNLSDKGKDCFELNFNNYCFDFEPDIAYKYIVVSGVLIVKCINKCKGYLWTALTDNEALNYKELKNGWFTSLLKIQDGIRVVFINDNTVLNNINYPGKESWIYLFTDHEVCGEFEITIVKNLNIIPNDMELFPVKINTSMQDLDLNQIKSQVLFIDAGAKKNVD